MFINRLQLFAEGDHMDIEVNYKNKKRYKKNKKHIDKLYKICYNYTIKFDLRKL